jgi:integrase
VGHPRVANPARSIEMFPEKPRERLLSTDELGRLGAALDKALRSKTEHPSVIACIRLLVLTGARLSEILKLKWENVDLDPGVLRLPDSKTGAKMVPLGAPAMSVLASLSREAKSTFVCSGDKPEGHFVGIQRPWRRIRAKAEMHDLRIHDLRYAFASVAAMAGDSLLLIGKVLGHRQTRTTERCAHLQDEPIRAVADKTSRRIAQAMNGTSELREIVPLKKIG